MRRAVSLRSSAVIGTPLTSRTRRLHSREALGPLATSVATISSTWASSVSGVASSCTMPSACARTALKRSAVTM